jgi:gas vesicle protein
MKAKFPLGAIVGIVAGVVAGVLTAPKSGKETRDDFKHKAEELKGKAEELKDKAADEANAVKKDLKGKLKQNGKKK